MIFNKIKEQNKDLKAFISASAIGYYGTTTSQKIFTETDPPANDFLGDTCRQWEQICDKFNDSGIRTVKIRTGVVLTKQGGALSKMAIPIKLGVGSVIGKGRQYLPWIHIEDLYGIYIKAISDTQMDGAYNGVVPDHKTNKEFTRTLALPAASCGESSINLTGIYFPSPFMDNWIRLRTMSTSSTFTFTCW